MLQVLLLATAALAVPFPEGDAQGPRYAPVPAAPAPYAHKVEKLPPKPFQYKYGVQDDYSKAAFLKEESQDANGVVNGVFKTNLPDGRIQTVRYSTSPEGGTLAEVTYEGEAVFPPEPAGGYGPYKGPGAYPGPPLQALTSEDR